MSSNHQKPITYGRKSRILHTAHQDRSSGFGPPSPGPIPDADFNNTHSVRLFSTQGAAGSTESTLSSMTSDKLGSRTLYQTPLPTQAAKSEIFKLSASKPVLDPPGYQFSPVPLTGLDAPVATVANTSRVNAMEKNGNPVRARTSSRNHKENTAPKQTGGGSHIPSKAHTSTFDPKKSTRLGLASPFTSRPSSPSNQMNREHNEIKQNQNSLQAPWAGHRTSLSDKQLNSNGAPLLSTLNLSVGSSSTTGRYGGHRQTAPQSARTSPTKEDRSILANHQRRPSAPSMRPPMAFFGIASSVPPQNYGPDATAVQDTEITLEPESNSFMMRFASYLEFSGGDSDTYFASSLGGAVDFNRPPSQMTMYAAEVDSDVVTDFFTHIRGRSTPERAHRRSLHSLAYPPATFGPPDQTDGEYSDMDAPLTEIYSPWLSDSIISPPSYHIRQRGEIAPAPSAMENISMSENMELTRPLSPQVGMAPAPIPPCSAMDAAAAGNATKVKERRSKPALPRLRTTGLTFTRAGPTQNATQVIGNSIGGEYEEIQSPPEAQSIRNTSGTARTRSGTIIPGASADGYAAGKRNRSGTIVPGGGGARRTRSGTVIQADRVERMELPGADEDRSQDNAEFQDETCSCCSSDDELMLRSHSHYDLGTEDLEWEVADPPSPVVRRLRRATRRHALSARGKKRGKNKRSRPPLGAAVEEVWENGIEGDIDDDELDLLGSFVPREW